MVPSPLNDDRNFQSKLSSTVSIFASRSILSGAEKKMVRIYKSIGFALSILSYFLKCPMKMK